MSRSNAERMKNIELAFQLMMGELGEHGVNELLFEIDKPPYENIYPTTWQYLQDHYSIERCDTMDDNRCILTGFGWMEGLRVMRMLEAPEMKARVGRVMAEIKKAVEGRGEMAFQDLQSIAIGAGVQQGFVYNLIEGRYIETVLNRKGAAWVARQRGLTIEIPVDFGMEII